MENFVFCAVRDSILAVPCQCSEFDSEENHYISCPQKVRKVDESGK